MISASSVHPTSLNATHDCRLDLRCGGLNVRTAFLVAQHGKELPVGRDDGPTSQGGDILQGEAGERTLWPLKPPLLPLLVVPLLPNFRTAPPPKKGNTG